MKKIRSIDEEWEEIEEEEWWEVDGVLITAEEAEKILFSTLDNRPETT